MSVLSFKELPAESRLFIFPALRQLSNDQAAMAAPIIEDFLRRWTVHQQEPTVGYEIRYGRFLLLGVDESKVPPSGCSIDALTRFMKELGASIGAQWLDGPEVLYRTARGVEGVTRQQFAKLATTGEVDAGTIVFNNTIQRLGQLETMWEIPANDSWHGRAFELKETPAQAAYSTSPS